MYHYFPFLFFQEIKEIYTVKFFLVVSGEFLDPLITETDKYPSEPKFKYYKFRSKLN